MEDLNEAIRCSSGVGKSACQAYTQRAMLRRLNGKVEEAKVDYESAAALGSTFAKVQLAALNPYAAMCNKMVAKMIAKVQRGENEETLDWGPPA